MSDRFLSCYGFGCGPARIISALTQPQSKLPVAYQLADRDTVFTYQGRYAISLVCRALKIGPGDEVLVPAYNCGAEVDPYVWCGAKAIFYRVDNRANIDLDDIKRRVTPATRIIHVTHFFGWPQEIGELSVWCRERGLYLLEDCALALFSKGVGDTIGKTGDAAFYSFVKSLPVPDGGILVINNSKLRIEKREFSPPQHRNVVRNSLPLLKKWFMHENKAWQRHELTRRLLTRSWLKKNDEQCCDVEREMPESNYFDGEKIDWSMSRLTGGILSQMNSGRIVETRRHNYRHLQRALEGMPSLQCLYDDLPNDVCPLSFPLFVNARERWCKALEEKGILVGGWPSYHRGFDWGEFPEARHLKNNLLTLPVHQDLEVDHMEYIAECVKTVAGEHGNYNGR